MPVAESVAAFVFVLLAHGAAAAYAGLVLKLTTGLSITTIAVAIAAAIAASVASIGW